MRVAPKIFLTTHEDSELHRWAEDPLASPRLAFRSRVVLLASEGRTNRAIAALLRTSPGTAAHWRARFMIHRLDGVRAEAPRSGRRPTISKETVLRILETSARPPKSGASLWTSRSMAKTLKVSQSTVVRVWSRYRLDPKKPRPVVLEISPRTGRDLVGMYVSELDRAVALSIGRPDGSSAPSAGPVATRSVPISPSETSGPKPRIEPRVALQAAVQGIEVTPLGSIPTARRPQEFLLFLRSVDENTPRGLPIHLLLDSPTLHHDPSIVRWLEQRPRFQLHTAPSVGPSGKTGFIHQLPKLRSLRFTLANMPQLLRAVKAHQSLCQVHPRPFVWTKGSVVPEIPSVTMPALDALEASGLGIESSASEPVGTVTLTRSGPGSAGLPT